MTARRLLDRGFTAVTALAAAAACALLVGGGIASMRSASATVRVGRTIMPGRWRSIPR